MAAQTISVNRNLDEAAVLGLANGETITIDTNATLTCNSDSRWGQQAAVLGNVTINATTGGEAITELAKINASVNPDNASITAIKVKTDLLTFTGTDLETIVSDKTDFTLATAEKAAIVSDVRADLERTGGLGDTTLKKVKQLA
jgi:hypothetical protein